MKRNGLRGTGAVFRFTLRQQINKTGWRLATLLPALLLLIGIPAVMLLVSARGEKTVTDTGIAAVYVADMTGIPSDYSILCGEGNPAFAGIEYMSAADGEAAVEAAEAQDAALALLVTMEESGYRLQVVRPDESALRASDVSAFRDYLSENFAAVARGKSGLTAEQLTELSGRVIIGAATSASYRDDSLRGGYALIREILEMALPYLCMMVIYFTVLIYGQGITSSVILEKSSKLMDTMLLSVRPSAMILGKTLAGWLAGILQLAAYIIGCVLGCVVGKALVLQVDPGSTMGILQLFGILGEASGLFTASGIALAVAILLAGFLLYCAIASVGGALASKPEDLGSTNSLFTFLLAASFLLTLFGENTGSSMSMISNAEWMNYVPFTAVMSTPARALLGHVSAATCLVSLALILMMALLAVLLAGRLYRLLTFRRGDPPKVRDIPKLLKLHGE